MSIDPRPVPSGDVVAVEVAPEGSSSAQVGGLRRLPLGGVRRVPFVTAIAGVIVFLVVVMAIFAPLIATHKPNEIALLESLTGPSSEHWLGLDGSGRDIYSRLVYGARTSLGGPAIVVILSTLVGVPLGLIAGYKGGLLDSTLGRVWDVMLAFPSLLLAILFVATFGTGFWTATLAIALVYVPFMARIVRGLILVEREKPYVAAARLQGFSHRRVLFGHLLPNIASPVLAQVTLNFGLALLDLAALAFIGLGVQPPTADWGAMLAEGKTTLLQTTNPVIWPALMVVLTVVSFNLLGDALAERIAKTR